MKIRLQTYEGNNPVLVGYCEIPPFESMPPDVLIWGDRVFHNPNHDPMELQGAKWSYQECFAVTITAPMLATS